MPSLISKDYVMTYNANICSCASFISLCILVLVIILPYFIGKYTGNWWEDYGTFHEQPITETGGNLIIEVEYEENNQISYHFNPVEEEQNDSSDESKETKLYPLIKFSRYDFNNDGITDQFFYQITWEDPKEDLKNLIRINITIEFEYKLSKPVSSTMSKTMSLILNTNNMYYTKVIGDLVLKQKHALPKYEGSELTLDYTTFTIKNKDFPARQIDLKINVPSYQEFIYELPVFTKLKFSWVQYCAIFIPIYIFFYFIRSCLFKNRVLASTIVSELPKLKIN